MVDYEPLDLSKIGNSTRVRIINYVMEPKGVNT